MPNKNQIKLIQTAVNAAGLRADGRYYLVLGQYRTKDDTPVKSCKQLNNYQIDNLLALCESLGWRHPGKPEKFYRNKDARQYQYASDAQLAGIRNLAGDLGWNVDQLGGMIERMTRGQLKGLVGMTPRMAHNLIESLKAMLSRMTGKAYKNLTEVETDMEVAKDGKKQAG